MTEDEMAGLHHLLDGHEFEWTPGVGDGQGGLTCCNSWGCKELSEWTELKYCLSMCIYEYHTCSVIHSNLALCDPMDCSPSAFSFQARILDWVAISYSEESSQLRDWTCVSCLAVIFFTLYHMGSSMYVYVYVYCDYYVLYFLLLPLWFIVIIAYIQLSAL